MLHRNHILVFLLLLVAAEGYYSQADKDYYNTSNSTTSFTFDCSFPILCKEIKCEHKFETDRRSLYMQHVGECLRYYGPRCNVYDDDRIAMNIRQPISMVNYSSAGFEKIRTPEPIMELVSDFWNKHKDRNIEEVWPDGNIYVNHWDSPTYMVNIDDKEIGTGKTRLDFKKQIWDMTKDILEPWAGVELVPSSMYGIRIYTEGAILLPHVDRLPLVISAMIHVVQDLDEPWPLEIYDRQGKAVNITMDPGDMLLFEPSSIIHGRPFPMKGRSHANLFIHFEPTGRPLYDDPDSEISLEDNTIPPYILPNSPEVENWKSRNPHGWTGKRGKVRRREKEPDTFCFIDNK